MLCRRVGVFQVNEVIKLEDKLYRVLVTINTHAVWISLEDQKAFPDLVELSQLKDLLLEEKLTRVDDPFEYCSGIVNLAT